LSAVSLALRLVLAALLAGAIGGGLVTALQAVKTEPLIRAAETFEHAHAGAASNDAAAAKAEWEPAPGLERWSYTLLANGLAATGYALILLAGFTLRRGVTWRSGLIWGLGGFAAFALAPMLGLPPALPGTELADLEGRQAWWVGTAVATAAGLALIAFAAPRTKIAGAIILALPHLVGAPAPEGLSAVPAEIAGQFVSATLFTNLVLWLALGALTGLAFSRFVRAAGTAA
jgi:cobalt transporter subunit CbtA